MAEIPRLGERGGGWVVLQFALMAAIIVAGIFVRPPWPVGWWVLPIGVLVALAGVAIAVSAGRAHKGGVTPFPQPRPGAQLVESGPYRVVRHPIYSGGILFFAGVSLTLSPAALVVTAILALVWALKAQVEEGFLRTADPGYVAYCERTRFRLVPHVY